MVYCDNKLGLMVTLGGDGVGARNRCYLSIIQNWHFDRETVHFRAQNGFVGRASLLLFRMALSVQILQNKAFESVFVPCLLKPCFFPKRQENLKRTLIMI